MTTYQRTADGGRINVRDIAHITDADVQRRVDQIQRDRCDAWLDIATERTGVHRDAILGEMVRAYGGDAEMTRELINDTAERLARPGAYVHSPAVPAVYHRGDVRGHTDARLTGDDAFRASLQRKLDATRADHAADDASDDNAEGPAPGNVPTVASLQKQTALESDEAFRAMLAAKGAA